MNCYKQLTVAETINQNVSWRQIQLMNMKYQYQNFRKLPSTNLGHIFACSDVETCSHHTMPLFNYIASWSKRTKPTIMNYDNYSKFS